VIEIVSVLWGKWASHLCEETTKKQIWPSQKKNHTTFHFSLLNCSIENLNKISYRGLRFFFLN
jgi:hypothetical protein